MLDILGLSLPVVVPVIVGVFTFVAVAVAKVRFRRRPKLVKYTTSSGRKNTGVLVGRTLDGRIKVRNGAGVILYLNRSRLA